MSQLSVIGRQFTITNYFYFSIFCINLVDKMLIESILSGKEPMLLIGFLVAVILTLIMMNYTQYTSPNNKSDISLGLQKEINHNSNTSVNNNTKINKILHPVEFRSFELIDIRILSKDTKLLKFKIPRINNTETALNVPIGKHITLQANIDGQRVLRSYTPCSSPNEREYFELCIKAYEFGKLSTYMHQLNIGDSMNMRGPIGRFQYDLNKYRTVGLIAAGTGLTPCLQVIRSCFENETNNTKFVLYYQNRYVDDILLLDLLEELCLKYPERLRITYFISSNIMTRKSSRLSKTKNPCVSGYIQRDMLLNDYPLEKCPLVCICGPSGFNTMVKDHLLEMNHVEDKTLYIW